MLPRLRFADRRDAALNPISVNLANYERIGTPGRACVSDPLPLRGRPPLQGGYYNLPLAKGDGREAAGGSLTHALVSAIDAETLRT